MAHNALRYQLRKQLLTLEARMQRLEDHQRNRNGRELARDSEEQAIQLENEGVVEALVPKTLAEIQAVRRALARLDAGLDVECTRCGLPIDPRRLAVLPEADTCARCASSHEVSRRL